MSGFFRLLPRRFLRPLVVGATATVELKKADEGYQTQEEIDEAEAARQFWADIEEKKIGVCDGPEFVDRATFVRQAAMVGFRDSLVGPLLVGFVSSFI